LPIEIGDAVFTQAIERPAASTKGRGNTQARNGRENVVAEHRGVPGDRRTPVMADNDRLFFSKRGNQER
jgi:hypothetical protein